MGDGLECRVGARVEEEEGAGGGGARVHWDLEATWMSAWLTLLAYGSRDWELGMIYPTGARILGFSEYKGEGPQIRPEY